MVTFSAALLQTRRTVVSLHLLSSLVHSLRLLACLLARLLPSLIACRFSTSLSPRCSNFASAIHNIHDVSHNVFASVPVSALVRIHFSSSTDVRKEVHGRRHNESTCLNSIPPCRLHFQRWPSIVLISKTPLPNIITVRSPTPMSSIIFISFPVDGKVTFTAALLQTRKTAVFLHLLYKLDLFTPTACLLASIPDCLPLLHVVLCSMFQLRLSQS
jgi:hypothetical protein